MVKLGGVYCLVKFGVCEPTILVLSVGVQFMLAPVRWVGKTHSNKVWERKLRAKGKKKQDHMIHQYMSVWVWKNFKVCNNVLGNTQVGHLASNTMTQNGS